jgi:phosphatidylserine/phosphatidylglycerophosphate/cardiolipin synthase-like enzyme
LTGSTNWTTSGLCTQLNNVLIVEDKVIAARFVQQWNTLVADGNAMPPGLKKSNSTPTDDNNISLCFAATNGEAEFKPVLDLIAGAKEGILFLMFEPGQSPLLDALLDRVKENKIYVRGVVSNVTTSTKGDIGKVGAQVVKSGAPAQSFHDDVLLPRGISAEDRPSWEETEFNVQEILAAHLIAIVHSKAIVIDPFSDDCAVITGSHNFSVSASERNDENLVIVRGNKKLAQAYAVHINGAYDHYSWRAYLGSGGDPDQIYKPLDGWKPGGSRAQELDFWMGDAVPPQTTRRGTSSSTARKTPARSAKKKSAHRASAHKTIHRRKPGARAPKSKETTKRNGRQKTSRRTVHAKAKSKTSRRR